MSDIAFDLVVRNGRIPQADETSVSWTRAKAVAQIAHQDLWESEAGDALYKNEGHAADIQVLLTGSIPSQPTEALAWAREYKGGRVFYTSLGAQDTFAKPDFRRMLANALFWSAGREPETKKP